MGKQLIAQTQTQEQADLQVQTKAPLSSLSTSPVTCDQFQLSDMMACATIGRAALVISLSCMDCLPKTSNA